MQSWSWKANQFHFRRSCSASAAVDRGLTSLDAGPFTTAVFPLSFILKVHYAMELRNKNDAIGEMPRRLTLSAKWLWPALCSVFGSGSARGLVQEISFGEIGLLCRGRFGMSIQRQGRQGWMKS
jgi:hypothetical protein